MPNMSLENWAVFVCRLVVLELVWGLENGLCWAGEIDCILHRLVREIL